MYKVYWTDPDGQACSEDHMDLVTALNQTNYLRNLGNAFVTMVGENPNQVGKMGVDSVEQGRLPDGESYTWRKRR